MLSMEMKTEGLDLYVDDFDEWKPLMAILKLFFSILFDSHAYVSLLFSVESMSRGSSEVVEYQGWHLMASLGVWIPCKTF